MSIHFCWSSCHFQTSDVDRIASVNGKLDVFDVYRANACIHFVSLGTVSTPCTFSQFLRRDDATPKAPGTG